MSSPGVEVLVRSDHVHRGLLGRGRGTVDADVLADEVLLVVEPQAFVGSHEASGPLAADLAVADPVVLGRRCASGSSPPSAVLVEAATRCRERRRPSPARAPPGGCAPRSSRPASCSSAVTPCARDPCRRSGGEKPRSRYVVDVLLVEGVARAAAGPRRRGSSCPGRRSRSPAGSDMTSPYARVRASAVARATQVATPAIAVSTSARTGNDGRETDVAVTRVVAEGERGAGRREGDAGLLRELDDPRRAPVEDVEADEVAARRARSTRPRRARRARPAGPRRPPRTSARGSRGAARMCSRTPSAEPKNCTCRSWLTLSGPIEAYCWWARYSLTISRDAARNGDPGAGEGDLARRREHHGPVRVPRRGGQREDVGRLRLVLGEVVEGVGVVPEDPEVGGGGRHRRQPARDLLGDDRPRPGWRRSARSRCP